MASRSRIRWENVAKLGAGGAACVALAAALPGLLRRPEPPPLESDVGFASESTRHHDRLTATTITRHRERDREGRHPVRRHSPHGAAPHDGASEAARGLELANRRAIAHGGQAHSHPDRRGGSRDGDLSGAGRPAEASRSPATAGSPAARSAGAGAPPIRVRVRALSGEGQAVRSPSAGWVGRRAVAAITVLAALALAWPAAARAGAYRAALCDPDLDAFHADATFERTSRRYRSDASCRAGGNGLRVRRGQGASGVGAWGAWVIRAPRGTAISALSVKAAGRRRMARSPSCSSTRRVGRPPSPIPRRSCGDSNGLARLLGVLAPASAACAPPVARAVEALGYGSSGWHSSSGIAWIRR